MVNQTKCGFILHPYHGPYETARRNVSDSMCVFWNVPVSRNKGYWENQELSMLDAKKEVIRYFGGANPLTTIKTVNAFGGWKEIYIRKINPTASLVDEKLYRRVNKQAKLTSLWIENPGAGFDLGFYWPGHPSQISDLDFDTFIADPDLAPKVLAIPSVDTWLQTGENLTMESILRSCQSLYPSYYLFYFSYLPLS